MPEAYVIYKMDRWNKRWFVGRSYSLEDARVVCCRHSKQAFKTDRIEFKKDGKALRGQIPGITDYFYKISPV